MDGHNIIALLIGSYLLGVIVINILTLGGRGSVFKGQSCKPIFNMFVTMPSNLAYIATVRVYKRYDAGEWGFGSFNCIRKNCSKNVVA